MEIRIIDQDLRLVPYYPDPDVALAWYQDPELCRQIDNTAHVYSPEQLENMYSFLCAHGACYYIECEGALVGDVTLRDNAEICIVVCREYQNLHIGRRCVREILRLAKEKGYPVVKANIYSFNRQSQVMFRSVGFTEAEPA